MAAIGIIGSGNVGANTAFFAAEKQVADVILYDKQEGLSTGKALDMMEAAPVRGYQHKIRGTDAPGDLLECSLVMVAAGAVREPGMKREDLYSKNGAIIDEIAEQLAEFSGTVVIATEPVDMLTQRLATVSGLPWNRVVGLGGVLDSTRLRFLIARELDVTMEDVSALVIGRHSTDMIPLRRYTSVSGVPVDMLMSSDRLEALFQETRSAGDLIVTMAQRASAYYGPSAAASDLAESVIRNMHHIMSVSLPLTGQYGVEGVAMSLPAVIGEGGVQRVLEPQLSTEELEQFTKSAADLRAVLEA
jgi:malate dehydrogenase